MAVITSRQYATPEFIEDGVNGLFLEDPTVTEILASLNALVDDKSQRVELGKRALETIVSKHAPGKVAIQMRAAYDHLLSA